MRCGSAPSTFSMMATVAVAEFGFGVCMVYRWRVVFSSGVSAIWRWRCLCLVWKPSSRWHLPLVWPLLCAVLGASLEVWVGDADRSTLALVRCLFVWG